MKKAVIVILLIISSGILSIFLYKNISPDNPLTRDSQTPNIILISIDTLRADHMSLYGYSEKTTPKMDQFSKSALVYDFAFCPIPKTSASIASMMTGLHPFVHKTKPIRSKLAASHIPLAEALKFKGYHNHAVVDNGNLSPKYQFNQGFDEYIIAWDNIEDKVQSSKFITEQGLKFLKNSPDKPFFLWLHYIEPHTPYIPPTEFIPPVKEKGRNINDIKKKVMAAQAYERKILEKTPWENHFIALYDGAVKYVDHEIGKILDLFKGKGLDKNTILIITSDHGEDLGEYNLFFDHGPLTFNAAIRIPLMVYFPNKKGGRIQRIVNLMDIYPTVLSQVGLSPHRPLQGVNLLEERQDRTFFIFGQKSHAIITSRGHLNTRIEQNFASKLGIQTNYFFDIFTDPLGEKNLISRHGVLSKKLETQFQEYFNTHQYLKRGKQDKSVKLSKKELENLKTLGYIE